MISFLEPCRGFFAVLCNGILQLYLKSKETPLKRMYIVLTLGLKCDVIVYIYMLDIHYITTKIE